MVVVVGGTSVADSKQVSSGRIRKEKEREKKKKERADGPFIKRHADGRC